MQPPAAGDRRPAVKLSAGRYPSSSQRRLLAWVAAIALLGLAACAAPGEPEPPRAKIPEVVTDLAAQQLGDRVILVWTPPLLETSGARLEQPPEYVIYRNFFKDAASAERDFAKTAAAVLTLPANLADTFLEAGQIRFPDPLGAELVSRHAGELAVYAVKSANRKGQTAGFSELASVRIYPATTAPQTLHVEVAEDAVELAWQAPGSTTTGAPIASLAGYRIYRSSTGEKGSFARVGSSPDSSFRDTQFEFGKTYYYFVRALAQYGVDVVESAESEMLRLVPQDRFPPRPPTGLLAIALPGAIELSWNPNPEHDFGGYNIYRRENEAPPWQRLNRELLKTPTFRDASVSKGKRYSYAVTALDAAGNESERSAEVREDAQ